MMKNYGGKMKEKNETRMKSVKSMEKMKSALGMKDSVAKPSKTVMGVKTKKTVSKLPEKMKVKSSKMKMY